MRQIDVFYDGKYPTACGGNLKIVVDGVEVYNKKYVCCSSGSVWFGKDWGEHVEDGELTWNSEEAHKFDSEIQEAVAMKLSCIHVCCGGCV